MQAVIEHKHEQHTTDDEAKVCIYCDAEASWEILVSDGCFFYFCEECAQGQLEYMGGSTEAEFCKGPPKAQHEPVRNTYVVHFGRFK